MAVPFGDYIPEEVKLVLLDAIPWLSDLLGKGVKLDAVATDD